MGKTVQAILWENVLALMMQRYGKENSTRFAKDTKTGPGTATRIKQQDTSIGLDTLQKIAREFGLQPWQLLVPNMDPSNPPFLAMTDSERRLYSRLKLAAQDIAKYSD